MIRRQIPERDSEMEPLSDPSNVTGFSSPAKDYMEDRLHIIQRLVKDPTNTYYFEADNNEMSLFGIKRGAIIVVDRTIPVIENKIIVVFESDEWIVRQYIIINGKKCLVTGKKSIPPIYVTSKTILFGVVTWSCNSHSLIQEHVRIDRLQ